MSDMEVEDRTFRVNFTTDGVEKLRDRVKDKLKEFMGDYTDDTLVEYVIVLLRNGRRKEEARSELNVFLGEDSRSFVAWLWDHLASHLNLYVQSGEPYADEAPSKTKPIVGDKAGRSDSHHLDSESERGKVPRRRHNREWKGLARDAAEPPPLRSSEIDMVHVGEEHNTRRKFVREKRSPSPQPIVHNKRSRPDEPPRLKESISRPTINASRRLLQFAVRDAVGTSSPRPSSLAPEPTLKRLRSVISTSTDASSLEDHEPHKIQSTSRVPNLMSAAIKAAAVAAEDVIKARSSGNVFDRLGHGVDLSETSSQYVGHLSMLDSETGLVSDSASDNEGFDDVNLMGHDVMDTSQVGSSGGTKGEDSLMVQYSVANNAEEVTRKTRVKELDQPPVAVANTSRKIVNISVNVNTWKPPHYQAPREVTEVENRKTVVDGGANNGNSSVRLTKENNNLVSNGNAEPAPDTQKESQKTLPPVPAYSTGRPSEDADSRTIFVSNVHFAATKDSLSRHFNKFGDVLKVVIVTDAATGQPKGSAYVEFMRKEAAESALSLDGTSFMSRLLKVVRRTSAHQEAAPAMTWPRGGRGSPFTTARFGRAPFPRGMSGGFRPPPRLPVKPGARSLQWKRDSQGTPTETLPTPSPTSRSLTYVRSEAKPEGNATDA